MTLLWPRYARTYTHMRIARKKRFSNTYKKKKKNAWKQVFTYCHFRPHHCCCGVCLLSRSNVRVSPVNWRLVVASAERLTRPKSTWLIYSCWKFAEKKFIKCRMLVITAVVSGCSVAKISSQVLLGGSSWVGVVNLWLVSSYLGNVWKSEDVWKTKVVWKVTPTTCLPTALNFEMGRKLSAQSD